MSKDSTDTFWKDIEIKYEGKILFKSYAELLHHDGTASKLSGIIFIIKDIIYFQDFEPENSIMGVPRKIESKYKPTEFRLNISNLNISTISSKMFQHCLNTSFKLEALKTTKPGFFDSPLIIIYNNSDYFIFNVVKYKQLLKHTQSHQVN